MKILKINNFNEKKIINQAVDYLNKGKIAILPTDTIYGLHCSAFNEKAIEKIIKIKKRDKDKPFIFLVSSLAMVGKFCSINKKQKEILKGLWAKNRPTTVILKTKDSFKSAKKTKDLAIRLPKNDFLIKIIKSLKQPLISSSLNLSGKKNLESLNNLNLYFKENKPDIAIDAGRLCAKASKIIDLRDINKIKIIRK